jgi:hypothetical protein
MRGATRALAVVSAAIAACGLALALAPLADAVFNSLKSGGSMTLAADTLEAPGSPAAAQTNCHINKSPEIKVEWTASGSGYATSYAVERRTGSTGAYELVAGVNKPGTSYTDKSNGLEYSTTYNYRVSTTYHSWTAASTVVSVKTLSKLCLTL